MLKEKRVSIHVNVDVDGGGVTGVYRNSNKCIPDISWFHIK